MYDSYSKSYHSRIEGNSKNIVKNVASDFDVTSYLYNRTYVEATLAHNISTELGTKIGVDIPVDYFKITDIKFPNNLIETSLGSALALQENELNVILQSVELIQSTTSEIVAGINADTQLLLQNSDNKVSQLVGTANAQHSSIVNTARSVGIKKLFDALNITSAEDKDALLKAMAVHDTNSNSTVMYEVLAGSLVNVN